MIGCILQSSVCPGVILGGCKVTVHIPGGFAAPEAGTVDGFQIQPVNSKNEGESLTDQDGARLTDGDTFSKMGISLVTTDRNPMREEIG